MTAKLPPTPVSPVYNAKSGIWHIQDPNGRFVCYVQAEVGRTETVVRSICNAINAAGLHDRDVNGLVQWRDVKPGQLARLNYRDFLKVDGDCDFARGMDTPKEFYGVCVGTGTIHIIEPDTLVQCVNYAAESPLDRVASCVNKCIAWQDRFPISANARLLKDMERILQDNGYTYTDGQWRKE